MKNVHLRLPEGLRRSFEKSLNEDRLRSMPNSFLPASICNKPGAFAVGDAWNMRHPLTGGGMTVGLKDVCLLKHILSPKHIPSLHDKSSVMNQLKHFYWKRKSHASVINILAQSLYTLFSGDDSSYLLILKESCFRYFQLGGRCVKDPISLLGGLLPSPLMLYSHFFLVVLYGIFLLISGKINLPKQLPSTKWFMLYFMRFIGSFYVCFVALRVILPYMIAEWRPIFKT